MLIPILLTCYAITASPGFGALWYLNHHTPFSAHTTTTLIALLSTLFAPALVGFGHAPALIPFVVSPLVDTYNDWPTWENTLVALLVACIALVVRRRQLVRGVGQE